MENSFIYFKEEGSPNHKKCFSVRTHHFNASLGLIYFYIPFKQYVFLCNKGVTLLQSQLNEISDFIRNLGEKTGENIKK